MRLQLPPGVSTATLGRAAAAVPSGMLELDPRLDPSEVLKIEAALSMVPRDDLDLLVRHRVPLRIFATDRIDGTLLGATQVVQGGDGRWTPRQIRIAARNEQAPPGYVLHHEIGHAVSVLRGQDRSEAAAERYANARLASISDLNAALAAQVGGYAPGPIAARQPAGPDPSSSWMAAGAVAALIGLALLVL